MSRSRTASRTSSAPSLRSRLGVMLCVLEHGSVRVTESEAPGRQVGTAICLMGHWRSAMHCPAATTSPCMPGEG